MRKILLAATAAAFTATAGGALAQSADGTFDVTAETTAAIAVSCTNLAFGTISVAQPNNTAATITFDASSGAISSDDPTQAYPSGGESRAECTVSNETGGNATAALSNSGAVTLDDGATNNLTANLTLSKASAIGSETINVGGTLSIPVDAVIASYTGSATLTVTD